MTIERLRHAAALAVDHAAKKAFFTLAIKLNEDASDDGYRNFYYNMRLDMERMPHHKYLPDDASVPVELSVRDYHRRMKDRLSERRDRYRRVLK